MEGQSLTCFTDDCNPLELFDKKLKLGVFNNCSFWFDSTVDILNILNQILMIGQYRGTLLAEICGIKRKIYLILKY